ncbi:MAG TPA: MFS transporter [Burkholderiaceae bacterium]|nr:MFS transporter [Burkholderiaceae bacterium]
MNSPRIARSVAVVFFAFAFNYFLSALLRAVVATLAPEFARELQLSAANLGLLAGAYFLGFASMQLPLGWALDRYGARRVLLCFLVIAVLGCVGFALARNFGQLVVARLMIGLGVSAGLMAPLAAFVRLYDQPLQLRLNSWMLMTGSLGMVASTLPVQALLPLVGWRGLFWLVAAALAVGMVGIAAGAPTDPPRRAEARQAGGYRVILFHPVFVRSLPLGFLTYGGLIAVQALWAGPWMTEVVGLTANGAAQGLFIINLTMLCSFLAWGVVIPRLLVRGWSQERLIGRGWPAGALVLLCIVLLGAQASAGWLALWCALTSVIALTQPAVAQAFPKEVAGRALSAFNLAIFSGVFAWQWGMGLAIDAMVGAGWGRATSHRAAMALLLLGTIAAGLWYWFYPRSAMRQRRAASTQG